MIGHIPLNNDYAHHELTSEICQPNQSEFSVQFTVITIDNCAFGCQVQPSTRVHVSLYRDIYFYLVPHKVPIRVDDVVNYFASNCIWLMVFMPIAICPNWCVTLFFAIPSWTFWSIHGWYILRNLAYVVQFGRSTSYFWLLLLTIVLWLFLSRKALQWPFPTDPLMLFENLFSWSSSSFKIGILLKRELIKVRPQGGVRLWQILVILTMNQKQYLPLLVVRGTCEQDYDEYQIAFYKLSDILSSKVCLYVQFFFTFLLHWSDHWKVFAWYFSFLSCFVCTYSVVLTSLINAFMYPSWSFPPVSFSTWWMLIVYLSNIV